MTEQRKEFKMTAIDFYTSHATNIINVPRPGHPEDPSGIAGVRRCMAAGLFAKDAPVMDLGDACQFAEAYAESENTRLREALVKCGAAMQNLDLESNYYLDSEIRPHAHMKRELNDCLRTIGEILGVGR